MTAIHASWAQCNQFGISLKATPLLTSPAVRTPIEQAKDAEFDEAATLERALSGEPRALRTIVQFITPAVQLGVGRVLVVHGRHSHRRNVREETRDLSQEIFAQLFANSARILRNWSPQAGASLRTYVRMVAERRAISILRSSRRNPWTEDPTDHCQLEPMLRNHALTERQLAAAQIVQRGLATVRENQTERGREIFRLLIEEDRTVEEVQSETGLKRNAVYQWRRRLTQELRRVITELMEE